MRAPDIDCACVYDHGICARHRVKLLNGACSGTGATPNEIDSRDRNTREESHARCV